MIVLLNREFAGGKNASVDEYLIEGLEATEKGVGIVLSECAGFGSVFIRRTGGATNFDVSVVESPIKVEEFDAELFPFEIGSAEGVSEYSEKFDTLAGRSYAVLVTGADGTPVDVEITLLVAK